MTTQVFLLLAVLSCSALVVMVSASKDAKAAMAPCKEMNCFFCRVPKIQSQCAEKCKECATQEGLPVNNRQKREDEEGGGDYTAPENGGDATVSDGGEEAGSSEGGEEASAASNGVNDEEAPPPKSSGNKGSSSSGKSSSDNIDPNDPYAPKMDKEVANKKFMYCCQHMSGFPKACHPACHYDVKLEELGEIFMNSKECGISQMNRYLSCASDDNDNTKCCEYRHILDGRQQCKPFCTGTAKTLGLDQQVCGNYLEDIMKCHWAGRKS